MKKILIFFCIFLIILFLGKDLNPFSLSFFTFHDETQPARIQQFTKELKNFHLPPRTAPDMNFKIGYPVFNFYAPTAYWITSLINLLGVDIINSLKLSFSLALIISFLGSFKLFNLFFDFWISLLGGFLYITSLYFPLNIFIRGNLAEIWFLSLFPISIYYIFKIAKNNKFDKKIFLTNTLILSFLLTSHNIFSILFLPWVIFFIFLLSKNRLINFISLLFALLISSYFWLPAIIEMKLTYAQQVASSTSYKDHFLCLNQLWQSNWGYGGSAPGCLNDGMSFKIGKIQMILFLLGAALFLNNFIFKHRRPKNNLLFLYFLLSSLIFLYLTLYQSSWLWQIFEPFMKLIQFPWRLIGLSLLGISLFGAYFFEKIMLPLKNLVVVLLIFFLLFVNGKYFSGQKIKNAEFEKKYLSSEYIENKVAYKVAEYLPISNDYQYWRSLEKKTPTDKEIKKISLKPFNKKSQTPIEKIANFISIISFLPLIVISRRINYNKQNKNG
ncbi:MAG: hypothetical protein ACPLRN_02575 [Microgenomates group bacterium]